MSYQIIDNQTKKILFIGIIEDMREVLESKIEDKLGFCPSLQEADDDGELNVYLHTDSYEFLSDEELEKLDQVGITEDDSLSSICQLLNISIEHYAIHQFCPYCSKKTSFSMSGAVISGENLIHIECGVEHDRDSRYDACLCDVCTGK